MMAADYQRILAALPSGNDISQLARMGEAHLVALEVIAPLPEIVAALRWGGRVAVADWLAARRLQAP
jgi:hypothetical protein